MAVIKGTALANSLTGTALADTILGYDGNDTINSGDGNDYIDGGNGNDTLNGGNGLDRIYGKNDNDTLNGGAGIDSLFGGYGQDIANGGDGNDKIYGDAGNDNLGSGLSGNAGDDTISGGTGNDLLNGDDGNDVLLGGIGNDTLNGGLGDDTLYGGTGSDATHGGDNNAVVLSGGLYAGGDTMSYADALDGIILSLDSLGGATANKSGFALLGDTWSGIEHLTGSTKNDILTASATINGNIRGGLGDDIINAGAATEMMFGDAGEDLLVGGTTANVDWFVAQYGLGSDRFENFNANAVGEGDLIIVDKSDFLLGALNVANFALDASALLVSATFDVASGATANTRLWFETDTRTLWADLDGTGTLHMAKSIAVIDDAATLSATDFWVVA